MTDPRKMSKADLIDVVYRVRQALWPVGNPSHEWSADTLEEISRALFDAGLSLEPEYVPGDA